MIYRCHLKGGFTLAETLVVLVIVGLLLLVGLPNILKHKSVAEDDQAVAKAVVLNNAKQSYLSEKHRKAAESAWAALTNDERYVALTPYFAYPPVDLGSFTPAGYSFDLGNSLYTKVVITKAADGSQLLYN